MDKHPLQFLASIENNPQTTTDFSYDIENDLPFIMSALEQNLSLREKKEDQPIPQSETENDSDDEDDELPGCSSTPTNRVQRRRSPRAKSVDSNLHKIKRRTIVKPVKFQININASEKEIRSYYMDKGNKVSNLKPSNLETIFEEGSPAVAKSKFFGERKLRRSLNCSDGFNVTKTTTKARKNRVRRLLGSAPKLERMTMDTFLERLKSMQSGEDEEPLVDPKLNHTV